jgi:hypothetical protein
MDKSSFNFLHALELQGAGYLSANLLLDSKTQYYNNTKDIMSISKKMNDTAKDLGVNVESLKEYNMLWDSVKNGNKITDIIEGLD